MQNGQDYEREINLLEIMWEFFIQWKPAVVFSLIFAVFLMLMMYAKDMKSYRSAVAAYQSLNTLSDNEADIVTEEVKKGLTEAEHYKVENAIFNIKTINSNEEKLNSIAKIDINGDRFNYLTLRYSGRAEADTMPALTAAYSDAVNSNDMAELLQDEDPAYADAAKVMNITGCSTSTSASYTSETLVESDPGSEPVEYIMTVSILLLKSSDINSLKKTVTKFISESDSAIKQTVPHEDMQLISSTQTSTLDSTLSTTFQKLRTDTQTLRGVVATDVAAFTDDQKTLYNSLLMKEGFSAESSYMAATESPEDEEEGSEDADKKEDDDTVSANSILMEEPVMPSLLSPKYAFIGFVAGLFIYGMFIVCVYILSGRVRSLDEVCDCYGIRGIDEIHERRFDTAWKRFVYSRKVYELRYAKIKKSYDDHIASAVRYISEYAAHNELKHVSIVPAYADVSESGLCRHYTDSLKNVWDKGSVPMEITKPWTTDYTFDAPGEKEGLVILMHSGDTAFTTLSRIGGYCKDYSVSVIGTILLEG